MKQTGLGIFTAWSNQPLIILRSNWFVRADYSTYFERYNCSFESDDFNASKIIQKYEDSIE